MKGPCNADSKQLIPSCISVKIVDFNDKEKIIIKNVMVTEAGRVVYKGKKDQVGII